MSLIEQRGGFRITRSNFRLALSLASACFAALSAGQANAQRGAPRLPPAEQGSEQQALVRKLPRFATRASLGLGGGTDGPGGRFAASLSAWPFAFMGASLEYQAAAASELLYGRSESFQLLSAGPSLRAPIGRLYLQLDFLFGAGRGQRTGASASFGSPVALAGPDELSGLAFTAVASAYWHPTIWELGPTLEHTFYDQVNITTLGFACGFALN